MYGDAKLAAFVQDILCFLVCCAAHVVLDEHAGELWDEHELRERMCIEREDPLQRSCLTQVERRCERVTKKCGMDDIAKELPAALSIAVSGNALACLVGIK